MAVRKVRLYPHLYLSVHVPQQPIPSAQLQTVVQDLIDTAQEFEVSALAANQIGYNVRVIAVRAWREGQMRKFATYPLLIIVNPQIDGETNKRIAYEGCASLPGFAGDVLRDDQIDVRGLHVDGTTFEGTFSGRESAMIQHAIDHLNGKVFLDRLKSPRTNLFRVKTG